LKIILKGLVILHIILNLVREMEVLSLKHLV